MNQARGGVEVDVEKLVRLLAAAHLAGCADWAEATGKAERDVRPLRARLSAVQRRVEVSEPVLARVAEAAREALDAHAGQDGPWTHLVAADLHSLPHACRRATTPRPPRPGPGRLSGSGRPATDAR